jgi:hypothetical protein
MAVDNCRFGQFLQLPVSLPQKGSQETAASTDSLLFLSFLADVVWLSVLPLVLLTSLTCVFFPCVRGVLLLSPGTRLLPLENCEERTLRTRRTPPAAARHRRMQRDKTSKRADRKELHTDTTRCRYAGKGKTNVELAAQVRSDCITRLHLTLCSLAALFFRCGKRCISVSFNVSAFQLRSFALSPFGAGSVHRDPRSSDGGPCISEMQQSQEVAAF